MFANPDQGRSIASAVSAGARSPEGWPAAISTGLLARAGGPRGLVSYDDAVALVCTATGWPVGHVWVHGPTGWRSCGAWYSAPGGSDPYSGLREATAITDLGSGRGIVAAVLHLESCRFLPGLEGLGSPLRREHAAALGLSGVVGVPVHTTGGGHRKVTAVLEFVTRGEVEPDGALAEALLSVAARARRRVVRKTKSPGSAAPAALNNCLDVEIRDNLAG
jgi:hypothetical protein